MKNLIIATLVTIVLVPASIITIRGLVTALSADLSVDTTEPVREVQKDVYPFASIGINDITQARINEAALDLKPGLISTETCDAATWVLENYEYVRGTSTVPITLAIYQKCQAQNTL